MFDRIQLYPIAICLWYSTSENINILDINVSERNEILSDCVQTGYDSFRMQHSSVRIPGLPTALKYIDFAKLTKFNLRMETGLSSSFHQPHFSVT